MVFRNGRIPYKLLKQYSNVSKYQDALKLSIREFSTSNGNDNNNNNNNNNNKNGTSHNNNNNKDNEVDKDFFEKEEALEEQMKKEIEEKNQRQIKNRLEELASEPEQSKFYKKQYDARYTMNTSFHEEIQAFSSAIDAKMNEEFEKTRKDIFELAENELEFYEHQINQLEAIQAVSSVDVTKVTEEEDEEMETTIAAVPSHFLDPLDERLDYPLDSGKYQVLMDIKMSDIIYNNTQRRIKPKDRIELDKMLIEKKKASLLLLPNAGFANDNDNQIQGENENENGLGADGFINSIGQDKLDEIRGLQEEESTEELSESYDGSEEDLEGTYDEEDETEGTYDENEEDETEGTYDENEEDETEGTYDEDDNDLETYDDEEGDVTENGSDKVLTDLSLNDSEGVYRTQSILDVWDDFTKDHNTLSNGDDESPIKPVYEFRYEFPDAAMLRKADPFEDSIETFDRKLRLKEDKDYSHRQISYTNSSSVLTEERSKKEKLTKKQHILKNEFNILRDLGYEDTFQAYQLLETKDRLAIQEEFGIRDEDEENEYLFETKETPIYINGIPVPFDESKYSKEEISHYEALAKSVNLTLDDFKDTAESIDLEKEKEISSTQENQVDNLIEENKEMEELDNEDSDEQDIVLTPEELEKTTILERRQRKHGYKLFKRVLGGLFNLNEIDENNLKQIYRENLLIHEKDKFSAKLNQFIQDISDMQKAQTIHQDYVDALTPKKKKIFKLEDLFDLFNAEAYAENSKSTANVDQIFSDYVIDNQGVSAKVLADPIDENGLPVRVIDPDDIWEHPYTKEEVKEYDEERISPSTSFGIVERYESLFNAQDKEIIKQEDKGIPNLEFTNQEINKLIENSVNSLPGSVEGVANPLPGFVNHSKGFPAYYDNHREALMHWENGDYRKVFLGDDKISHLLGNVFMDTLFTKEEQIQLQTIFSSQKNLKKFIKSNSNNPQDLQSLLKDIEKEKQEKKDTMESDKEKLKLFKDIQAYLDRDLEIFTQEQINLAAKEQLEWAQINEYSNQGQPQEDLAPEFLVDEEGKKDIDQDVYNNLDESKLIPEHDIDFSIEGEKKGIDEVNPFGLDMKEQVISDEEFAYLEKKYGDLTPIGPQDNTKFELLYDSLNNKTEAQKQRTFEQLAAMEKNKFFLVDLEREIERLENSDEQEIPLLGESSSSTSKTSEPKPLTEKEIEDDLAQVKEDIKELSIVNEDLSKFLNVSHLLESGLLSDPIPKDIQFYGREEYSRKQLGYYFYEYKQRQKAMKDKLDSPFQEDIKKKDTEKSYDFETVKKQSINLQSVRPQDAQYTNPIPISFEPDELKEYMDFKASVMPERYLRMNENIENLKEDIDDLHYDREDKLRDKEIVDYLKADLEKSMVARLSKNQDDYQTLLNSMDKDLEFLDKEEEEAEEEDNNLDANANTTAAAEQLDQSLLHLDDLEQEFENFFDNDPLPVDEDEFTVTEDISQAENEKDLGEIQDGDEEYNIFDDQDIVDKLQVDENGEPLKFETPENDEISHETDMTEEGELTELEGENENTLDQSSSKENQLNENEEDNEEEEEEDEYDEDEYDEDEYDEDEYDEEQLAQYHSEVSSQHILEQVNNLNQSIKYQGEGLTEYEETTSIFNPNAPRLFKPSIDNGEDIDNQVEQRFTEDENDLYRPSPKDLEPFPQRPFDELKNIFYSRYIINYPRLKKDIYTYDFDHEINKVDIIPEDEGPYGEFGPNPYLPLADFDPYNDIHTKKELDEIIQNEMLSKLEDKIDLALAKPLEIYERYSLDEPINHNAFMGEIDGKYVYDYTILTSDLFLGIDKDGRIVMAEEDASPLIELKPDYDAIKKSKEYFDQVDTSNADDNNNIDVQNGITTKPNVEKVKSNINSNLVVYEVCDNKEVYGYDKSGRPIYGFDELGNKLVGFNEKGLPLYNILTKRPDTSNESSPSTTTTTEPITFNWPYESQLESGSISYNPFTTKPLTYEEKKEISRLGIYSSGDKKFIEDAEEMTDSLFTDDGDDNLDLDNEDFEEFSLDTPLDPSEIEELLGKPVPIKIDDDLLQKFQDEDFDKMKQMNGSEIVKFMEEQYNMYDLSEDGSGEVIEGEVQQVKGDSADNDEYSHEFDESLIEIDDDEQIDPKAIKQFFDPLLDDPKNQIEGLDFYFDEEGQLIVTSPKGLEQVQSYYEELELLEIVEKDFDDDINILRSEADMYIKRNEKKLKQLLKRRTKAAEYRMNQLEKNKLTPPIKKVYSVPVLPEASNINSIYRNVISPPNSYLKLDKLPMQNLENNSQILNEAYRVLSTNPYYSTKRTKKSVRNIRQEFTNAEKYREQRQKELVNPPEYTNMKKIPSSMIVEPEDVPGYFPYYLKDIDVNAESGILNR